MASKDKKRKEERMIMKRDNKRKRNLIAMASNLLGMASRCVLVQAHCLAFGLNPSPLRKNVPFFFSVEHLPGVELPFKSREEERMVKTTSRGHSRRVRRFPFSFTVLTLLLGGH